MNEHANHNDRRRRLRLVAALALALLLATLLTLTGCKPGDYNNNMTLDIRTRQQTPEEIAAGQVKQAEADKLFKENDLAYQVGLAETQLKADTARARVAAENQAMIKRTEAESTALIAKTQADSQAAIAQAQASAATWTAIGAAAADFVVALGIALVIVALGAVVFLGLYLAICLAVEVRRINARSRVTTVTLQVHNTRIDYMLLRDENDTWHIVEALGNTSHPMAKPKAIEAMRPRLIQAAQQQLALQEAQQSNEGVIVRAWAKLFGRRQPGASLILPTFQQSQPEAKKVEVNLR